MQYKCGLLKVIIGQRPLTLGASAEKHMLLFVYTFQVLSYVPRRIPIKKNLLIIATQQQQKANQQPSVAIPGDVFK